MRLRFGFCDPGLIRVRIDDAPVNNDDGPVSSGNRIGHDGQVTIYAPKAIHHIQDIYFDGPSWPYSLQSQLPHSPAVNAYPSLS
jgi:hypothetical protein